MPRSAAAKPSTKPIRVGIVGLGMGRFHVKAYQAVKDCHVTALCDANPQRLAAAAKEFGVEHTFADATALFTSGLVDAVTIATPNFTHCQLTLAALKAGLHVLCEKPLAMNANEASRMIAAAKAARRKLAVHFNHRMTSVAQTIARYARSGKLGQIYFARTVWHRRRGIPRGMGNWFIQKDRSGGGCLIDLGVHILDTVLYAMGHPRVLGVCGQTYNKFGKLDLPDQKMNVDDFVSAYVRFEGGATLALEVSWASHHEHPEQMIMALYGTEGGVVRRTENYVDAPLEIHHRQDGNLATTKLLSLDKAGSVQADFIAAIRENRQPICSGAHGLAAMRIIDAIYASSRTGKEVRLKFR